MDVYSPEMYHTVLFTRTHRTHGNNSKCLEFLVDGQISSIACMMRTCSAGLPRHSGQWQNVLALVHSSIEPGNKDGQGMVTDLIFELHPVLYSLKIRIWQFDPQEDIIRRITGIHPTRNCYGMTTQSHKMGISIYLSVYLSIYVSYFSLLYFALN